MTVLFLSPHPDDVELFCGATVAAMAARAEVRIADLTRGELSSNGNVDSRALESAAAARALGVERPRIQLGLPDAGLSARDHDQVSAVVELIRELAPGLVFAPWVEDRHPDHVAAGELARRAVALLAHREPGSPREHVAPRRILYYPCHFGKEPDLLVDVSGSMHAWEDAVRCYASQFLRQPGAGFTETPINQPGFLDQHRRRREAWGSRIGVACAEGFVHDGPWPTGLDSLLEV